MSQQEFITRESVKKGYYVDKDGVCYNGDNKKLLLIKGCGDKLYLNFGIRIDKGVRRSMVHRLQAFQKYGDKIFEKGIEVRHKNNIASDNSFDNILIGNHIENMMDIPQERRVLNASHPKHNHHNIILDRNKGMTYKELMLKYNISSKGTMSFIIKQSLALTKTE